MKDHEPKDKSRKTVSGRTAKTTGMDQKDASDRSKEGEPSGLMTPTTQDDRAPTNIDLASAASLLVMESPTARDLESRIVERVANITLTAGAWFGEGAEVTEVSFVDEDDDNSQTTGIATTTTPRTSPTSVGGKNSKNTGLHWNPTSWL